MRVNDSVTHAVLRWPSGVMSTRSAQRVVAELLTGDYDIGTVIAAALADLERSMARNPRELVIETILEGYRHEHRLLAAGEAGTSNTAGEAGTSNTAGDTAPDLNGGMFTELFDRALADGKLPAGTDIGHLAYLAMTLVSDGARHWAAGAFGSRSFADVVGADILTLIAGYRRS